MGFGLLEGDWEADHKRNKKILYIIEPVVESLAQVGVEKKKPNTSIDYFGQNQSAEITFLVEWVAGF